MNVVIVGGHGKIALRLEKLLAERGDSPRGIIRKTEQAADLEEIGAEPIVLDIENVDDISDALAGADAIVFAAGAGPGSGPGAQADGGLRRRGEAGRRLPRQGDPPLRDGELDRVEPSGELVGSDASLPGGEGRGRQGSLARAASTTRSSAPGASPTIRGRATCEVGELDYGQVTRDDVAAVIAECLVADNTIGKEFDLLNDGTPIAEALDSFGVLRVRLTVRDN